MEQRNLLVAAIPSALMVGRAGLLLTLVVLPWFFGGVHAGAQSALALSAVLGLGCCLIAAGYTRGGYTRGSIPLAILPLVCAVLMGVFQLVPLGQGLLGALSPQALTAWSQWDSPVSAEMQRDETQFRQSMGEFGDTTPTTLSLYPASTRHDLCFLILALAIFLLGVQLFSRTESQKWLWGIVAANGALFAFFGLAQQLVWSGKIYGTIAPAGGGVPFAAFVNRNNAAGYLNLCLAAAIGFAFCRVARRDGSDRPFSASRGQASSQARRAFSGLRQAATNFLRWFGQLDGLTLAAVLAIVVIAAGVICSLSRGGWISLAAAVAVIATVLATAKRTRYALAVGFLVLIMGSLFVQWLGRTESIGSRWHSLYADAVELNDGRLAHWPIGLRAGADYWVTGSGLGTYRYVYRPYLESIENVWFYHAENQYLEAFVEGGVFGLALLMAAIAALALACRRLLREPRNSSSYACGIAGTFALVSQVVQSCFDFGLYLPANMALFALICGSVTGRAAALDVGRQRMPAVGHRRRRSARLPLGFSPAVGMPALITMLLCAALFGFVEIRKANATESAMRTIEFPAVSDTSSLGETNRQIVSLASALDHRDDHAEAHLVMARLLVHQYRLREYQGLRQQSPAEATENQLWSMTAPLYLHAVVHQYEAQGRTIERDNLRQSETVQTDLRSAASHLLEAVRHCPLLPDAYLLLAELGPVVSRSEVDAIMLSRASRVAGGNAELLRECGLASLQAGHTVEGLAALQRSCALQPSGTAEVLQLASPWADAQTLVDSVIPASPLLLVELAKTTFSRPADQAMRAALLTRAAAVADSAAMEPAERLQFEGTVFELQGNNQKAVERLTRAVRDQPEISEWRFQLASLLQVQGDLELAWEHARTCVRMEPNNARYDALLRELVRARLASR